MEAYTCVYYDERHHRFCLFVDAGGELHFAYWYELKKHGIRHLPRGAGFTASLRPRHDLPHARGVHIDHLAPVSTTDHPPVEVIQAARIGQAELCDRLLAPGDTRPAIFIDCTFDEIDLEGVAIARSVALIDCTFSENFRLIGCTLAGNLWCPNSTFLKHFSLKSTTVTGDIHLEGADFSGLGGASFRGVVADNLYLDLGVNGGEDMFWLNEVAIAGTLSIGGTFHNEIQLLERQDEVAPVGVAGIGTLVIGKELYAHEKANRTTLDNTLHVRGMAIAEAMTIESLACRDIVIDGVRCPSIQLDDVDIANDLTVRASRATPAPLPGDAPPQLRIRGCSIGRHLKLDDNAFQGALDLAGSAVGEVSYLENNAFDAGASLNLHRFTTSRLLMHPAAALYGRSRRSAFAPRRFGLLAETTPRLLGDQYCALKHWLADAGSLELEDVAFFHMRQCYQPRRLTRWLLGGVFGWGVRLSNIALSSALLVLAFSLLYLALDAGTAWPSAFAMSLQSFISSFFGEWGSYAPDGMIASVVTLESFLGVLFITVFIGAYIRKLLR